MRNCPHIRFNFKSAEFSRKKIWEQKRSGGGEKEGGNKGRREERMKNSVF